MGITIGPKIINDGLVLCLDDTNGNSYVRSSDVNMVNWTLGSGGVTGYSQNGATVENNRVYGTNPMGESAIVWETSGDTVSNADGGWNTSYYTIDSNYTYRFSVWVKRISDSGGGTFYFGLSPTVKQLNDDANESNPYWECISTGSLTKDQWQLYVGHCFYQSYTGTDRHIDTGVYTVDGGKIRNVNGCTIGVDCKWVPNTTTARQRVYHYYCTDGTTQLQFYNPRMDKCDGGEPTINNLLTISPTKGMIDLAGNNNGDLTNMSYDSNKKLVFGGGVTSGNQIILTNPIIIDLNSCAIEFWMKRNVLLDTQDVTNTTGGLRILYGNSSYSFLDSWVISGNFYFRGERDVNSEYWALMSTGVVADLDWHHVVISSTSGNQILYFDGNYINTYSPTFTTNNVTVTSIGRGYGSAQVSYGSYFDGYISNFKYYITPLTAPEILINYNSTKSKFGK